MYFSNSLHAEEIVCLCHYCIIRCYLNQISYPKEDHSKTQDFQNYSHLNHPEIRGSRERAIQIIRLFEKSESDPMSKGHRRWDSCTSNIPQLESRCDDTTFTDVWVAPYLSNLFVLVRWEGTVANNWSTMLSRDQEIRSVVPPTQLIIGLSYKCPVVLIASPVEKVCGFWKGSKILDRKACPDRDPWEASCWSMRLGSLHCNKRSCSLTWR